MLIQYSSDVYLCLLFSILELKEKEILGYTYSSGTSIASSECSSDDLYNDDEETLLHNIHLSSVLLPGLDTSDISGKSVFLLYI